MVNSLVSYTWPADFPEDCPPEQALPADGTYYRIVKTDPPESSDFVSMYHQDRNRAEDAIRRGRRTLCETMGLSFFADIGQAVQCAGRYRRMGKKIETVTLTPNAGKALETPSEFPSHHTWWREERFDPTRYAQVVHRL